MSGVHRASNAEVRVRRRADRLRRHDVPVFVAVGTWWAAVVDWARIPCRNARLAVTVAWAAWVVPASGMKCATCRTGHHRGCGWLLTDPACGCGCPQAAIHRRELVDIERWAGA